MARFKFHVAARLHKSTFKACMQLADTWPEYTGHQDFSSMPHTWNVGYPVMLAFGGVQSLIRGGEEAFPEFQALAAVSGGSIGERKDRDLKIRLI